MNALLLFVMLAFTPTHAHSEISAQPNVPSFAFTPGDSFREGCDRAGMRGDFRFARFGRTATIKFPEPGYQEVIFQTNADDPHHWLVRNDHDELALDFAAGVLAYRYDDDENAFACEGVFTRKASSGEAPSGKTSKRQPGARR